MPLTQSFILLPCHSLEDFPTHFRSTDADSLLANWTAAWHPQLVAATNQLPTWRRADEPGEPKSGNLFLVPSVSESWLPAEFHNTVSRNQGTLLTGFCNRKELNAAIFKATNLSMKTECSDVGRDQIGDFYALGYAFLQVQLMTRQLRGSSNLDEADFESVLVAAVVAWIERNHDSAKAGLSRCFDLLQAEKNAYYPVQPELIDLVLMADKTIGKSFSRELQSDHLKSILLTGELGRTLKNAQTENFERLKKLIENERINVVGGLDHELDDTLFSAETTVRQIRDGLGWFQSELGIDVSVFARRRFGLTSELPAILEGFNFIGALHCSMTNGKIPIASTSNIRWEASDGSSILAFAQVPEDANDGLTFLRLAVCLGQAIDSAHVATLLLTHWPDRTHFCFEDLLRIGKFGQLFGKFTTLTDFFDAIYDPGYGDTFTPDEYRGEYLLQAIRSKQQNPISRIVDYWYRTYSMRSLGAALVQATVVNANSNDNFDQLASNIKRLESRVDRATSEPDETLDDDINAVAESIQRLFENGDGGDIAVINSANYSRTIHMETANRHVLAKSSDPGSVVRFADSDDSNSNWILNLPPMSLTHLPEQTQQPGALAKEPKLGQDNRLRNEFFEVMIDKQTGGILSVDKYDRRNNLLTQQLSARIPGPRDPNSGPLTKARYATMVCDDLKLTNKSRAVATITTSGRLVDALENKKVTIGEYQQRVTVFRGKPVIEVEIILTPIIELESDPNHYFCSRLAWKHDSAELYRSVQEASAFVMDDHFDAPAWIEIRGSDNTITVLPGGLPFHRRSSRRTLDSILIVAGESKRTFRMGIGVNLKYPHHSAADFLTPPLLVSRRSGKNSDGGWFFHFNCKNVMTTWWLPIFDDQHRCIGVELRCKETEQRSGQLEIRCPFPLSSARRVNFLGEHLSSVDSEGNIATIGFHGSEYFQLQLNWNP